MRSVIKSLGHHAPSFDLLDLGIFAVRKGGQVVVYNNRTIQLDFSAQRPKSQAHATQISDLISSIKISSITASPAFDLIYNLSSALLSAPRSLAKPVPSFPSFAQNMTTEVLHVSPEELTKLEAALLNTSGSVPLHNRFRALFTLKALQNDEAVRIISKGKYLDSDNYFIMTLILCLPCEGFADESALLKHELAYCLGQIKNTSALPVLESVLTNEKEDPMVRHEVSEDDS